MKRWWASKTKMEIFLSLICILTGITVGIWGFIELDKTPATEADYKLLEEQVDAISKNHDLIFSVEGKVEISREEIKLTIENGECKVIVKYNSNFEVTELTRQDKCRSIIAAILLSIFFGICCAGTMGIVIIILMLIWVAIRCIYEWLKEKSQKSVS